MYWIGFDFDGTIADTSSIIVELYNSILASKYGGKKFVSTDDVINLQKLSLIEKIKFLRISPLKLPFFIKAMRKLLNENISNFSPYGDMKNILLKLSSEYNLVIISSNSKDTISNFLNKQGITSISQIHCDKKASLSVKDKTIRSFLKQNKINPECFLYIGDEVRDIIACKKAGVPIISVAWGLDTYSTLCANKPDFIATQPEELFSLVKKIFFEHKTM